MLLSCCSMLLSCSLFRRESRMMKCDICDKFAHSYVFFDLMTVCRRCVDDYDLEAIRCVTYL
jgi:hypothetical protein